MPAAPTEREKSRRLNGRAARLRMAARRWLRQAWIVWRALLSGRIGLGSLLKPYMPRSLFGRSLIIIIAPVVLTQGIVTYIFFERHWEQVTRYLSRSAAGDVAMVLESFEAVSQGPQAARKVADLAARTERTMRINVAHWPEDVLPSRPPISLFSVMERKLSRELARKLDRPYWFDARSLPHHVEIRIGVEQGVLRMLVQRNRIFTKSGGIFVIWMLGASVVLLTVAILFLRNQVRPIQRLASAAESFGKGRDMPDFRPAGAREVRRAALAFIDMKDRIQRHIQQRTEMLAGVSHDLRTPITRLKLELAMFEDSPEADAMRGDLEEMERMLEEYLAFARGQEGETAQDTDLAALLREIVQNAHRRGQTVELKIRGPVTIPVRRHALTRAISNLIDNAAKHSRTTEVKLRQEGSSVRIVVDDDGPGIPEDKWEEAFRPFHRLDEGRNLESGGVGLGLAVSRDIVRGHGGDLTLDHSPLGGLRAIIKLPV